MIYYPNFDDLNKFKLSPLHGETSEIGKKYFVGCYETWLKDGIYAVTNIDVEISTLSKYLFWWKQFLS